MKLNREQIIKALECLLSTDDREFCESKGCPFADCDSCVEDVLIASLSLIKELTEEIDYWKQQAFNGCMERGRLAEEIKRLTDERG